MKDCYDNALRRNPSLSGRIVAAWNVEKHVPRAVHLEENTTGSEEFGSCIVNKIEKWSFEAVDDGPARSTFVFAPED